MTDAAIIYRTHVNAIRELPEDQRLAAYEALIDYCLDDSEDVEGVPAAMLTMAKPVLDVWKNKKTAGKKGGEVSTSEADGSTSEADGSTTEAQVKHTASTPKHTASTPQAKEKEKVKEREKVNTKLSFGEYGNVRMTAAEYDKLSAEYGEQQTDAAVKYLDEYIGDKGYKSKSHYLAIRRWVFDAIDEKKQKPPNRKPPGTKFQNFPARQDAEHKDLVAQVIAMNTGG